MKSEEEGRTFIQNFFRVKGWQKPKWMKDGGVCYPHISLIQRRPRKHISISSSDESSDSSSSSSSSSDNDTSDDSIVPARSKNKEGGKQKIGVDPSLGKDSELFGVGLKSVTNLEAGEPLPT